MTDEQLRLVLGALRQLGEARAQDSARLEEGLAQALTALEDLKRQISGTPFKVGTIFKRIMNDEWSGVHDMTAERENTGPFRRVAIEHVEVSRTVPVKESSGDFGVFIGSKVRIPLPVVRIAKWVGWPVLFATVTHFIRSLWNLHH